MVIPNIFVFTLSYIVLGDLIVAFQELNSASFDQEGGLKEGGDDYNKIKAYTNL
jgi:hypothetical protein